MKKSPSKSKKKLFGKTPIVSLGPSPAGRAAVGARVGFANIIIDETGALNPPPARIDVNAGDAVGWLVTNNSDKEARIKNKKFKKHDTELSPIFFLTERVTVARNGGKAMIFGFVTHLPAGESDDLKYTVEVRGKRDADYDPDLIIRRPPV
jgi:hypothetical protein